MTNNDNRQEPRGDAPIAAGTNVDVRRPSTYERHYEVTHAITDSPFFQKNFTNAHKVDDDLRAHPDYRAGYQLGSALAEDPQLSESCDLISLFRYRNAYEVDVSHLRIRRGRAWVEVLRFDDPWSVGLADGVCELSELATALGYPVEEGA